MSPQGERRKTRRSPDFVLLIDGKQGENKDCRGINPKGTPKIKGNFGEDWHDSVHHS
jgi:hypothetical protein